MLQHLYIKDFAIVSTADISFLDGMTVITGETGAGKSILLDALSLAFGERADSQWVRPGAEKCEIAVTFDISALPAAVLWLTDLELTESGTQQCIIRRILYANGRSKAFINGRPATSQQCRMLGEYLIQIHGQHQHQLLLKSSEQLRLLDAFGQHDVLVSQVKATYKEWEKLSQQLQKLKEHTIEQARIDLLQYQIAEIEALKLQDQEITKLYQEHDRLANAQSFISASEAALSLLETHEEGNVCQLLHLAQQALRALEKFKPIKNAQACFETAHIHLQEGISEVNHFLQQLDVDPERLQEVEQRLERIHDMARKHRVDPEKLLEHHQQLQAQIELFSQCEEKEKVLLEHLTLAKKRYQQVANQLTQARQDTAKKLAQEVSECIQQLGMPGAVFTVDLLPHQGEQLYSHGNESVSFGISANLGHAPQPLTKVASGGELSRISLALELTTTKYLATPCLLFDEVDVGISGKTGAIVGKCLANLSRSAQVLCITHLPQVAAFGEHHLHVVKIHSQQETTSEIHTLTETQRIEEIARMLGGIDVTAQARANAKQLLKNRREAQPA